MKYTSVHHSAPMRDDGFVCYKKGKIYTCEEYSKLIHRRQLIKGIILLAALGAAMVVRAYVFFEYGI